MLEFLVYIDGSGKHKPRRGGIGIRLVYPDAGEDKHIDFHHFGWDGATNNQMELMACVKAFDELLANSIVRNFNRVTIHSDSRYLVGNIVNAKYAWPKNKYIKLSGGLVENAELWKDWLKQYRKLIQTLSGISLRIIWKKRCSDEHMKAVDKLAKASSEKIFNDPLKNTEVRKNKLPVKPGKVDFSGEKVTVFVVTSEWQSIQRMNKYTCQVLTRDSQYYREKGTVYSADLLSAGHRYLVVFEECRPGICRINVLRRYKTKKELTN